MRQRVVKLEKDKRPPGPVVRIRRAKPGETTTFPFLVGYVDEKGGEDFRGLQEYATYDRALKAAQERAHGLRIPVKDATGVEAETRIEEPAVKAEGTGKRPAKAPRVQPAASEMPPLASLFALPSIDDRIASLDSGKMADRIVAAFNDQRAAYLSIHEKSYGDSRDNPVRYSQKVHDQIQGQIQSLCGHLMIVQSILYAYLERAFARIDELEKSPLIVDNFDAQVAEDDRTVELSFGSGEHRRVASFRWPVPVYRGVHREGQTYQAGDAVTWGGSMWLAQRETSEKPNAPNSGFCLAVKKGRDGKDAREVRAS